MAGKSLASSGGWRLVLFEVLPLRTQGMGKTAPCTFHVQSDPDCQFQGQGLFWRDNHATGPRLHLIFFGLSGPRDNRESHGEMEMQEAKHR